MRQYFLISGYWKDNKQEFEDYVVTNFDDTDESPDAKFICDEIFFFGLEEYHIKEAIELKEDTAHDFVITSYKKVD